MLPAALFKGLTEKRLRERAGTRVLGLPVGLPVMQVRRSALTFGDRPVEARTSVIDTSRHDYVNQLSRPTR